MNSVLDFQFTIKMIYMVCFLAVRILQKINNFFFLSMSPTHLSSDWSIGQKSMSSGSDTYSFQRQKQMHNIWTMVQIFFDFAMHMCPLLGDSRGGEGEPTTPTSIPYPRPLPSPCIQDQLPQTGFSVAAKL